MSYSAITSSEAEHRSLVHLLDFRQQFPLKGEYNYLREGTTLIARLGFDELAVQSRAIAARLEATTPAGERALLLFPTGAAFLPAFFGCLRAGIIAVPVPLPDLARRKRSLPRMLAIAENAAPAIALTTTAALPGLRDALAPLVPELHFLDSEAAARDGTAGGAERCPTAEDIAYLQYTSGSTASPRGVMIRHGNVLANLAQMRRAFGYDCDSRIVSWLPHFHDYGLVEGLLQPLYSGIPGYVQSPLTILKRPLRWLQAISRFGATHSHAPNFAYELCAAQSGIDLADLALHHWRMAGNGAEPIRADTLRRFAEAFAACGFRSQAFFPAYGLAEATLYASARVASRPWTSLVVDADALEQHSAAAAEAGGGCRVREVVSCGTPQGDSRILVVEPATRRVRADGEVGEIWLADGSVGDGYWRDLPASEATFRAQVEDRPAAGRFLRTGDLGFIHEGELYVTGRLKDLIILAGMNHYPQDIEATALAASHELRREHCVAFASERDGIEELIVVAEPDAASAVSTTVLRRVRNAIADAHGVAPAAIVVVGRGAIPKTSSGKLQRAACRTAWRHGTLPVVAEWHRGESVAQPASAEELEGWLCAALAPVVSLDPSDISHHRPFAEYGINSRLAVALTARLEDRLGGRELHPTLFWEHPTIAKLCSHLANVPAPTRPAERRTESQADAGSIAIVGLACRFPEAENAEAYWSLLREGRSGLGTSRRLPGVKAGFLSEVADFDAQLFEISDAEAEAMDPQQRLLLEVAWEALEDAGFAEELSSGTNGGVFVGIGSVDFGHRSLGRQAPGAYTATGISSSIAANRLSYVFNLTGPSLSIDAACASSLVAVHQACRALRAGDCSFALAGGASMLLSPEVHQALADTGALSPSSLCRTFDANADGYVRGEGCGLVVLKRLDDAVRDGDPIHAVVRGSAVNQNGCGNGLISPNPKAQTSAIRAAVSDAGLTPDAIDYVEAHGTGTRLGDLIELGALRDALDAGGTRGNRCWVGSVKTNIGHLEAAAGIAGLIKVVLAMRHGEIPPHVNLVDVHPLVELERAGLAIPRGRTPWPRRHPNTPWRAGVSSFGFGGTNAHVVLEQAPPVGATPPKQGRTWPLIFSARSDAALRALALRHADRLSGDSPPSLAQYCATAALGRAALPERFAIVGTSGDEIAAGLRAFAERVFDAPGQSGRAPKRAPGIGFMFTGQGAQYAGMTRRLYAAEASFRRELDACDTAFESVIGRRLLPILFEDATGLIDRTEYAQPALFAVEYALARLLIGWGVTPSALIGHSFGEYAAACIADVCTMPDAMKLVAQRGRLIADLTPPGAMLAVATTEADLMEAIRPYSGQLAVAAVNTKRSCVVSGDPAAVAEVGRRFASAGVMTHRLDISRAFHSPLMDGALDAFRRVASEVEFQAPRLTLIGNVDGVAMAGAPDADYWTRHLRQTVRFADGIATIARSCGILLEIGPRPVLSGVAAQAVGERDIVCLPTLKRDADDVASISEVLSRLYVCGRAPSWRLFFADQRVVRTHGLPTYPFERQHFALPPLRTKQDAPVEVAAFGHVPVWRPASPPTPSPLPCLVLSDKGGVGAALTSALRAGQNQCELLDAGLPSLPGGHDRLRVVCLWPLDWPAWGVVSITSLLEPMVRGLQALARSQQCPIELMLVTRRAQSSDGGGTPDEAPDIAQAAVWGLGRSLRREFSDWNVRLVDLACTGEQAARTLATECSLGADHSEVCWRGDARFELGFEPHALTPAAPSLSGAWVVTGGLGRLGLSVAERLTGLGATTLALIGRSPPSDAAERRIALLRGRGVKVEVHRLDITNGEALTAVLGSLASADGLEGIVHAAAVIEDDLFSKLDPALLHRSLASKVDGAWNLHLATRDMGIRYFVLFSSLAGLLGNIGQSAYAAANSSLDALAAFRRACGLPAISLDWGIWSHTVADSVMRARIDGAGMMPIETEDGLEAFARVLADPEPQLALVPMQPGQRLGLPTLAARPVVGRVAKLRALIDATQPADRRRTLAEHVLEVVARLLGQSAHELRSDRGFVDLGLSSLNIVELRNRLQRELDATFPTTLAFDHPTPYALAGELLLRLDLAPRGEAVALAASIEPAPEDGVAIVGMACRMPGGVSSPEEFWALLRDGIDAISVIPADRWDVDAYHHPDPEHPGTIVTRHGGFVDGIDGFDPAFFGIAPREARSIDPQQRILLETCQALFEHAGVPPSHLVGSQTSVFIGMSTNEYSKRLSRDPDNIDAYLGSGNALSLAANRISYVFGLEGPSVVIDTACSSSLVAVHQALQSLRSGESDLAIAGGVNLLLDPTISINHSRARMLSPDGRCKTFSAAADGFVRSEGCGLVLLRPLAAARAAGDRIFAVVRGSAVNQDGRSAGLTVPNGPAQERLMRQALRQAHVPAASVGYVEAHGTGTPLGDPIEAAALTAVFAGTQPLIVGSVKTNIGHLEAAAGAAGLLKVALALDQQEIPAHINCQELSPHIDWPASSLRIPMATEPWPTRGGFPRRAGVSSFGFGGTNAHVVVEEAAPRPPRQLPRPDRYILPLSAKTETALQALARRFSDFLLTTTEELGDVCFTAAVGRDHHRHRLVAVGTGRAELQAQLATMRFSSGGGAAEDDLMARYVAGADIDWSAMYAGQPFARVTIPGHPMQRVSLLAGPPVPQWQPTRPLELVWRRSSLDAPVFGEGRWVLIGHGGGWSEALAAALRRCGRQVEVLARHPDAPAESIAGLLASAGSAAGIVWLGGIDAAACGTVASDQVEAVVRRAVMPALALSRGLRAPTRLWLITREAQVTSEGDGAAGFLQAPLWGFGRSLALERPEVFGGLLDLPGSEPNRSDAEVAATLLCAPRRETQYAVRGGSSHVPRLLRAKGPLPELPVVSPDAGYLVTGGFGDIGRAVVRCLVEAGARNVWLVGRKGPDHVDAEAFLAEIATSATVRWAALDIGDAPALARQIDLWEAVGPRLRGVVHAAGLTGRTQLEALEWDSFALLMHSKARGTLALAETVAGRRLDFFVCCSSIAALWGGREQAAYAAANAFLDSFAAHRVAQGLPAASVALGAVRGTRMVAGSVASELQRTGLHTIPLATAASGLLRQATAAKTVATCHSALVAADFIRFAALYSARAPSGLFAELEPATADAPLGSQTGGGASGASAILDWLRHHVALALQVPESAIDPNRPLSEIGLDSLIAMELRDRCRQHLHVAPLLADLLSSRGLTALAARLAAQQAERPPAAVEPPAWIAGEV